MNAWWYFAIAAAASLVASVVVRAAARRGGVVDRPEDDPARKVHSRPVPLLGGLAIFVSFFTLVAVLSQQPGTVTGIFVLPKHLWGIFIGACLLMLGGYLDDRYRLSPRKQIIFPVLATLAVIASGVGVKFITNPLGGVIRLDSINIPIASWGGVTYHLTLWADVFSFVWLMGMAYTTKFLDGLDGLVSGITAIGSVIVFLLSMRPPVLQPETANLAIILAGACTGFLALNWHPARLFLGEGGSLLTGFLLGTLAIIAGGKIATALLIMGIPMLDVAWVIVRRALVERRSPFYTADKKHLHFRLLDVGFSHRGAVLFLYLLTAVFGAATLLFRGAEKLLILLVLGLVMVGLATALVIGASRRRAAEKP
ncbi:MAG: undecaprenyl/decaprenyl-phosphate alpha-N-acetylglucosaminyl 1-phosphate transferase [Candidatus Kerfeldbacteria bacterium]|nr:undecaprenyl/decaprenyl-phosphate alpha-N-acetylglucosaminyl 1-phosphate transferase [Candidatus Kerfeldbacteria bacterium]